MAGINPVGPNQGTQPNPLEGAFSSPLTGLAAGLLQSSQPSFEPQGLGGGLARGFGLGAEMARQQQEMALKRQQEQRQERALEQQGALQAAQIDRLKAESNMPFGGKIPPGAIGQEVWLQYIKNTQGEDSDLYKNALNSLQLEKDYRRSWMNRQDSLSKSATFRLLPADEKRRLLATAVGMGYDPSEAASALNGGQTLKMMADQKDLSLNDVQPIYPLQGEEIKNLRNRQAFVKELNFLDSVADEAQKDYGRRFFGYSPVQLWDAVKNEDPDKQGRYLAARAVAPEISALRLKAAGGNVGIEAIREMQDKAMANIRTFEPLVSGEARSAMNDYVNEWLEKASGIFNDTIEAKSRLGERNEESASIGRIQDQKVINGNRYTKRDGVWYKE